MTIIDVIVSSAVMGITCLKGTASQTFLVKEQLKKICIDVSVSLHLGQVRSDVMPLFCRFSPKECFLDGGPKEYFELRGEKPRPYVFYPAEFLVLLL